MILTLEYESRDGLPHRMSVRPNEVATFGSSKRADEVIEGDPNIAPVHFTTFIQDGNWIVEAQPGFPLRLNGIFVPRGALRNGDRIRVGNTDLRVNLPAPPNDALSPSNPSLSVVHSKDGASTRLETSLTPLPTGIAEGTIPGGLEHLHHVANGLQRWMPSHQRRGYFLWNQRRFREADLAEIWKSNGTDLIGHIPEEFLEADSLAIAPYTPSEESIAEVVKVMSHDAGVFLISPLEEKDLCEGLRIAWAWYMRPSLLLHQLRNGSKPLASILLQGVDAVMVVPSESQDLVFLGKKETLEPLIAELVS